MHYKNFVCFLFSMLLAAVATLARAESVEGQKVVIQHGTVKVTQDEVKQYIKLNVPPEKQDVFVSDRKRVEDTVFGMFVTRELANAAIGRGLSEEERLELNEVTARTLSKLQLNHIYEHAIKPDFTKLAKESYLGRIDKFTVPDTIHVKHILISMDGRSDTAAFERANEVLTKLKSNDKPFSDLAIEYSDDPSVKDNKGDLGNFTHGRMVKPFEDAAFALVNIGDIAGPVKTKFGYHIIQLVAKEKSHTRPFEDIKQRLIEEQKSAYRKQLVNAEVERFKNLKDVKLDDKVLSELVVNPLAQLRKD